MEKRTFLKWVVTGIGGTVGLLTAIPVLVTALSPALRRTRGPEWRAVGRLDEFALNTITQAPVQLRSDDWARSIREQGVFVSRVSAAEVVVFSRSCTDLSCPVVWDGRAGCFFCPCHGGIFTREGERMAGPPRRPLYRFNHRIRDGVVEIDLNSTPPIA